MSATHTPITVEWDPETDAICRVIVEAVADAKNVDPLAIERPLYDIVDPDALARLFVGTTGGPLRQAGRIRFPFEDCEVTVASDCTITVSPDVPTTGDHRPVPSTIEQGFAPE